MYMLYRKFMAEYRVRSIGSLIIECRMQESIQQPINDQEGSQGLWTYAGLAISIKTWIGRAKISNLRRQKTVTFGDKNQRHSQIVMYFPDLLLCDDLTLQFNISGRIARKINKSTDNPRAHHIYSIYFRLLILAVRQFGVNI